jgi:hypothetical protein
VEFFGLVKVCSVHTGAVLWMYLTSEMRELILISNVFQEYQIFGVERNIPTLTALVEEVLAYKYDRYVPVVAVFREQVTDLVGIIFVQKVVKYYETRFALRIAEDFR